MLLKRVIQDDKSSFFVLVESNATGQRAVVMSDNGVRYYTTGEPSGWWLGVNLNDGDRFEVANRLRDVYDQWYKSDAKYKPFLFDAQVDEEYTALFLGYFS